MIYKGTEIDRSGTRWRKAAVKNYKARRDRGRVLRVVAGVEDGVVECKG